MPLFKMRRKVGKGSYSQLLKPLMGSEDIRKMLNFASTLRSGAWL